MGWSMHMGIVHNYLTSEPVIEFPDGRFVTAYPNNSDSYYYTKYQAFLTLAEFDANIK